MRQSPRVGFGFADTSSSGISLGRFDMFLSTRVRVVCRLRPALLFKVAAMNRNTMFDPTNLGNTPTNDLAHDLPWMAWSARPRWCCDWRFFLAHLIMVIGTNSE